MREESPFFINTIPLMSRSLRKIKIKITIAVTGMVPIQKVLSIWFICIIWECHSQLSGLACILDVESSLNASEHHFCHLVRWKRGTRLQHKGPDGKVGGCFIHQAGSVKLTAFAGNNILSCSWAVASLGPHKSFMVWTHIQTSSSSWMAARTGRCSSTQFSELDTSQDTVSGQKY